MLGQDLSSFQSGVCPLCKSAGPQLTITSGFSFHGGGAYLRKSLRIQTQTSCTMARGSVFKLSQLSHNCRVIRLIRILAQSKHQIATVAETPPTWGAWHVGGGCKSSESAIAGRGGHPSKASLVGEKKDKN